MRKKLILLLVVTGVFGTVLEASEYVKTLNYNNTKSLIESLGPLDIQKSIKVAVTTRPIGGDGPDHHIILDSDILKKFEKGNFEVV